MDCSKEIILRLLGMKSVPEKDACKCEDSTSSDTLKSPTKLN